jgi:hypothetical protein
MSNAAWLDSERPVFTVIESRDGLEYSVAIDRPRARRVLIPFFGDSREAQNWIDRAGPRWHELVVSTIEWRKAA